MSETQSVISAKREAKHGQGSLEGDVQKRLLRQSLMLAHENRLASAQMDTGQSAKLSISSVGPSSL